MKGTRFEFDLDGLFNITERLDECNMSLEDRMILDRASNVFNRCLPVPDIYNEHKATKAYFTEEGLVHFEEPLREITGIITKYLENEGYGVLKAIEKEIPEERVLYKDAYQVVVDNDITEDALTLIRKEVENNPEGYELYFDYRDKIEPESFCRYLEGYRELVEEYKEQDLPLEELDLTDFIKGRVYIDWRLFEREYDEIEFMFYGRLTAEECEIIDEYLNESGLDLREAFRQEKFAGFTFDIKDLLGEYHANMILTTEKERDEYMGSIPVMFYGQNWSKNDAPSVLDNALSYLVYQQGHSLTEVTNGFYSSQKTGNAFVDSVVTEFEEWPLYSQAGLTALFTINRDTIGYLDRILKAESGAIQFPKETMLGFFNPWVGTGSLLEIELEKPFTVPVGMVKDIQIETRSGRSHEEYTVDSVYGLVGSCWNSEITMTDSDTEIEATVKAMQDDYGRVTDEIFRLSTLAQCG